METTIEDWDKSRRSIIENLGRYFQKEKKMAPIASKILSTLIIIGNRGITFEQLVKDVEASKSTVITYLNNLIDEGRISFYTKEGDRKRYFIIAPQYLVRKIESQSQSWTKEIAVRKEVLAYKEEYNKIHPGNPYSLNCEREMLKFLKESVDFFDRQIEKIKS